MAEPSSPSDNPAVVLLNTGADHHVGPHRMYVPLARRWAALGFSVLRFDLVGLGDSESNDRMPVNDSYPLSALNDVRDAISFLRHERGYRSIILAGMCSGAFHSLHAAEPLLSAVIAVNPSLFHHAGDPILPDPHYNNVTEARRVAASLFRPAKWRRLVEGKVDVVTSVNVLIRRCFNAITNATAAIARTITNEKSDSELAADLFFKELPVHLIFNEGDKAQLFFEREIAPRLKRRDHGSRVTIDIVPGADHTFMALRWQSELADLMTNRLLEYRSSDLQTPAPPAAESIAGVRS